MKQKTALTHILLSLTITLTATTTFASSTAFRSPREQFNSHIGAQANVDNEKFQD